VLAAGAVVCSSLGAVTAIAYADTLFNGVAAAAASALSPQRPQCPEGMALISGGELTVGSDSTQPTLQLSRPAQRAWVEFFFMDTTEVTVSRYHACEQSGHCAPAHRRARFHRQEVSSADWQRSEELHSRQCNAGRAGREQHPINCVSYRQASSYCAQRGQRLPSEREWELAARGLSGRRFPWGDAPPTAAHANACGPECTSWHQSVGLTGEIQGRLYDRDDGFPGTAPVASFPDGATPEAVYDLVGNVFEWTSGSPYSYATPAAGALTGSLDSTSAVIRGGSYNSGTPELLDPALRYAMRAELHSHGVGFRCAASPAASH
jgi:formylglycine-generating enzyme required for sulfatase activity